MSWKDSISAYGKELETEIKIGDTTYTAEDVVSVNPHYEGVLYSSVMKVLDLQMIGEISLKGKTIDSLRIGARVGDEAYDYIDLGSYIVKECTYDVETNTTNCECYDKMLSAMIPYELIIEYPSDVTEEIPEGETEVISDETEEMATIPNVTVGDLLQAVCNRFGWELATPTFTNSEKEVTEENFDDKYTFRDVLDQIAQVSGGIIAFKTDGKLYVIYPTESGETIDESNLKSLKIGEKYGPVNSLVLARTPQEDNIYKQDAESIELNGLCEVKIENNLIMDSHRDDFLDDLFERINGTTYFLYELESFGIGYLNLGDIFTLQLVNGAEYQTLMLNDDLQITQGMSEKSSLEFPKETETDYQAATETDRLLKQVMLKVNKQEGIITALISSTKQLEDGVGQLTSTVEQTMTSEAIETLVTTKIEGIEAVDTQTGCKLDKDGLQVFKSDSDMKTLIDDNGMDVSCGDEKVLVADSNGVDAVNLTARKYLIIGDNSRFENYKEVRTGCFYIGGDN